MLLLIEHVLIQTFALSSRAWNHQKSLNLLTSMDLYSPMKSKGDFLIDGKEYISVPKLLKWAIYVQS